MLNMDASRFWEKVDRINPDSCWNWKGRVHDGYGEWVVRGKTMRAHRVALSLTQPPLLFAPYCCHRCNNKLCCNPEHLYWGDAQTNADDRINANVHRLHKGVKHDVRDKVLPLLALGLSKREIARRLGCSRTAVLKASQGFPQVIHIG